MRNNKHRKSSAFRCDAGSRCNLVFAVWSFVGFVLLIHLYTVVTHDKNKGDIYVHSSRVAPTRELEEVEEENFRLPPPRSKRNPRAVKRRGPRRPPTVIDEFLDESSEIHSLFFPDQRTAVVPTQGGNDSMHFYPGRLWLDTDGNPIQAHGGGILYDKATETYYWYGENKDGPTYQAHKNGAARVSIICQSICHNTCWVPYVLACINGSYQLYILYQLNNFVFVSFIRDVDERLRVKQEMKCQTELCTSFQTGPCDTSLPKPTINVSIGCTFIFFEMFKLYRSYSDD